MAISKVTFITTSKFSLLRYPDNAVYVTAIKELHQPLGGRKLHTSWVKGHQEDNTADYEKLLDAARLNVDVDQLASE